MEDVMTGRRLCSYAFLLLVLLGAGLTIAGEGIQPKYQASEKAFYLPDADLEWIEPGLKLEIRGVEFQPPNVIVTFRISEDRNRGLDRLGIETTGAVSTSFVLGRIKPGESQYTAYTTRIRTSRITGEAVVQATSDSGGTYASLGDGVYQYTLGT